MSSPITIVVASTPRPALAIGKSITNDMPWPRLRSEMGYFARVTSRVPPPPSESIKYANAVIMGRKTWESLPPKFRPLPNRINVVVSRSPSTNPENLHIGKAVGGSVLWVEGIEEGVRLLRQKFSDGRGDEGLTLHKIFIIGGSQIYKLAMALPRSSDAYPTRILHTTVLSPDYAAESDVDVYFPEIDEFEWEKGSVDKLIEATGEERGTVEGVKEEKGVSFEFGIWERQLDRIDESLGERR